MSTQAEREAEVAALIARLEDENDPYDAHHGNDRSEESLEHARVHNEPLYLHITKNIETGDKG